MIGMIVDESLKLWFEVFTCESLKFDDELELKLAQLFGVRDSGLDMIKVMAHETFMYVLVMISYEVMVQKKCFMWFMLLSLQIRRLILPNNSMNFEDLQILTSFSCQIITFLYC